MERQLIQETEGTRRTVASFPTYAEAQRAVDHLSDQNFPVQRAAIVAEGLRVVEQVTGKLNYGRALLNGAASGAVTGAFIGVLFGLFSITAPVLTLALSGLIAGAIIGALMGLLSYVLSGGKRDFTSVSGMQAERYNVVVDAEVADEALRTLQTMAQRR